jgi:Mg/Co/Ni transporter MgtE
VPTVRLRVPHPKLARLHPAELADLVEAASHREGEEILAAVHEDPELEADLFEELESTHQREFLEERDDAEIAAIIERMEADDAADTVAELPEERREPVLQLLPPTHRRRIRTLLGYDPATAGGLMSPDFVCLFSQATVREAIERARTTRVPPDIAAWIFVMNVSHRLRGGLQLAELLRADEDAVLGEVAGPAQRVRPEADLEEVARLMADFDLTIVPVVDAHDRVVGVVSVDDVLELVLPRGWRRRFNLLGGE